MSNSRKDRIQQGYTSVSPIPTQVVSNEEFLPPPQTFKQAQVEWLIDRGSERISRKLGINRRDFLKTTGGMALAFVAMNHVFGKFFEVLDVEAAEPQAVQKLKGKTPFIITSVHRSTSRAGKKACLVYAAGPGRWD